jgi:pyruvate/2-oxoacid:ferredoxin oxidoreductase alpha subunit
MNAHAGLSLCKQKGMFKMNGTEYNKKKTKVITGNSAAAHGAMLCRPEVLALYPITPQTEVVEELSKFHASGELDAEMVEVEAENSAMNIITAASAAGSRTFTATSSYGLVFMYDALLQASGYRVPLVMVNVNRETPGITAVSSGQQDMISTRDSGWIQIIASDCQEILDFIIMAYRLAEDFDIQVPVMVNYDGFYLSYLSETVEIPSRAIVDGFLAPLKDQPQRPVLIPGEPTGFGTHGILEGYLELRYKHSVALERAKAKFDEIDKAFEKDFGRSYGGQIEEYRTEDAEMVLVASGSLSGTAQKVIDLQRDQGVKIGLIRLRMFRPFPRERLVEALRGKKAIGVIDRSICFGWNSGPIYVELRALSPEIGNVPMMSFIDGIANMDVSVTNIQKMVEIVKSASTGDFYQEVTWIGMEEG